MLARLSTELSRQVKPKSVFSSNFPRNIKVTPMEERFP